MMKLLLLALCAAYASAFSMVAPVRSVSVARSDVVMAAKRAPTKKKGVNPALFATGIKTKSAKEQGRGLGRKSFKDTGPKLKAGAAAGMWIAGKPWLENEKMRNRKVSKFQGLAGKLGSKERPGGGAGIFFLGAHLVSKSPLEPCSCDPPPPRLHLRKPVAMRNRRWWPLQVSETHVAPGSTRSLTPVLRPGRSRQESRARGPRSA